MDLVDRVSQSFAADRAKSEKGVCAILSALRLSVGKEGFDKIKAAVPGADALIGKATAGGRTAEIAAIVAPGTLLAALAAQGWQQDEIGPLAHLVVEQLRPVVGDPAIDTFLKGAPGLTAK